MNPTLQNTVDLFVRNRTAISEAFRWNNDFINISSALLFTGAEKEANLTALKVAEGLLGERTNRFSVFQGKIKLLLLTRMVLSEDAKLYLEHVHLLYELLGKRKGLTKNEYLALTAIILAEYTKPGEELAFVERTDDIYHRMKAQHPYLTGGDDMMFAAILAVAEAAPEEQLEEAEKNYSLLKKDFKDSNSVQSLSHVLSLYEESADEKCAAVARLFGELKNSGHRMGTGYALTILGPLAMLKFPEEEVLREIAEAEAYLKEHKGFGTFRMGTDLRRLLAAETVLLSHLKEGGTTEDILISSMLAFTISMDTVFLLMMMPAITSVTIS